VIETSREHLGWVLHEAGPENADHRVLLLPDAGTRAWVVYGENDDVGITPDERQVLAAASHVTLIEIADTGHFALNQKPDEIAAIVLQAVSSATG
jgi:pimeloyl-ACP methyl ester carboxylesterase